MFLLRYQSALKKMRITEDQVAKVVKDRIFSAAFHPCTSSLLMAAGDKWGKVGLWKMVCVLYLFTYCSDDDDDDDVNFDVTN